MWYITVNKNRSLDRYEKIILKDGTIKNLGEKTEFMGIINVTPDSFFENSRAFDIETAVNKAALFIEQGAFILDIGGGIY